MKANEIKAAAVELMNNTSSAKEIRNQYKVLAEKYGKEAARAIVDNARELRAKDQDKLTDRRDVCLLTIDKKALEWNFDGLKKDKDFKALAGRAACKCPDVLELVAKWYPDTINGWPACKVTGKDGSRTWQVKEKYNPQAVLKACLKQIAKAAKGAKAGTTTHTIGEPCPVKVKKSEK